MPGKDSLYIETGPRLFQYEDAILVVVSPQWEFLYCTDGIFTLKQGSASVSGLILGLRPANERSRYKVTTSLIGWAQA